MAETERLAVWGTARASFTFLAANRAEFLRAAAIPFAGICASGALTYALPEYLLMSLVNGVAVIAFLTLLAVQWHRFYLLGGEAAQPNFNVRFDRRFWRFLLYIAVLWVSFLALFAPAMMTFSYVAIELSPDDPFSGDFAVDGVIYAGMFIFLIATFITLGRVVLVFPAIAVDLANGISDDIRGAWRCSKGNGSRIAFSMIVANLLVFLPFAPVIFLVGTNAPGTPEVVALVFLESVVSVVSYGVNVTIVSIAFDRLTKWREQGVVGTET